jgi:hypothetical protein
LTPKLKLSDWASDVVNQLVWQHYDPAATRHADANEEESEIVNHFANFKLPWLDRTIQPNENHAKVIKRYVNVGLISVRNDPDAMETSEVEYSLEESADDDISVSHEALYVDDNDTGVIGASSSFFVDGSDFEFLTTSNK